MCPDVEAAATKAASAASAINKSIEDGATSEEEEDEEDTSEDESDHEQGLLSAINLYWFFLSRCNCLRSYLPGVNLCHFCIMS